MTKRIYGGYNVTHNATALGKRTVQSIDGAATFDSAGNMNWDGYTIQELNEIVGVMPLSHYGTHNYLPAGVSGDFVGASENSQYRRLKHFIERDGTYVALRSGTNGSISGLYYSYLPDILNKDVINSVSTNTNVQYQPGYIPAGYTPVSCVSTDTNVVCGQLITSSGEVHTSFYTSLMNGTLDDSQHTGFLIPSSTVLPEGGELIYCMLGTDGYIYYFGSMLSDTKFELSVVRVLFNATNGTFTATRLTGFNGSVFYPMSNYNNIKIAGGVRSTSLANEPYVLYDANLFAMNPYMVSIDIVALQDASTGNIRVRVNGDCYAATTSGTIRPQHGFSFVFNPNSKSVNVDSGYATTSNAPMRVTISNSLPVAAGNVVTTDELYVHNGAVNIATTYNYTPLNVVVAVYTPNLQNPPIIQLSRYNVNITPYNMLNFKQYSNSIGSIKYGQMNNSFGSIIGSYITGPELLSATSTKQVSTQANGSKANSYAVHSANPTFSFRSLTYGTMNGYEPTTNRAQIVMNDTNRVFISTVSGSTVTTNGGIFVQGLRESTPLSYNATGGSSGTISVNSTQLLNLKNSEFAKFTETLSPGASKDCTLYVPQQSDIPAFAMLSTVTDDLQYVYRFIEVNVSSRTGTINTISFKRLVSSGVYTGGLQGNNTAYLSDSSVGITIYDGGSFYFVGGADPMTRNTIGNSIGIYFRGIVDKSTSQFSRLVVDNTYTSYSNGTQPFALPGQGFGIIRQADLNCKQVFFSYGTTIADFDAWTPKVSTPINVVSQDVAQGFIVYFTEETPVMLSGKSFTLPITTINLTSITASPANKTFYVYVQLVQGIAQYTISQNVIAETGTSAYNLFWIGNITTNALQIDSIDIIKRSRLDIFGESLTAAGSSFPVSYGTPAGTGTINW